MFESLINNIKKMFDMQRYVCTYKYEDLQHRVEGRSPAYAYGFCYARKPDEALKACKSAAGDKRPIELVWVCDWRDPNAEPKLVYGTPIGADDRIARAFTDTARAKGADQIRKKGSKKEKIKVTNLRRARRKALAVVPQKPKTPSYWPNGYNLKKAE